MDARQLRYFLAVVDHGGVTRAAEALFVAQPSVSHALRALERELDVELFRRVGRGLELSSAGTALVGPARQVLAGVASTSASVRRIEHLEAGRIDIAVTSDLAVDPLLPIIRAFRDAHPGIWVNVLQAADADAAADHVRRAECELALCSPPEVPPTGTAAVALGRRPLVLALPPGHVLFDEASIPLARLANLSLVAGPPGDVVRDLLDRECERMDVTLRVALEVGVLPAHPRLVATGAGAAVLPPDLAREAEEGGAHLCRIDPEPVQAYGFVYRKAGLSAAARAFVTIGRRAQVHGASGEPPVVGSASPSEG
ncbi:LysR family transcriptional regulator [Tsukamurella ocularis]|uniref:LysR family transcriptional regulator n=1 Tax=Tsukamurella ocularis TaxID=1970234 RepID=UPI0039EFE289